MYIHHPPNSTRLQDLALVFTAKDLDNHNRTNTAMHSTDSEHNDSVLEINPLLTDPLTQRVLNIAVQLLQESSKVTVYEVAEVCCVSVFPIRQRLNLLVNAGKLQCLPGAGRRPAQFFLLESSDTPVAQQDRETHNSSEDGYDMPTTQTQLMSLRTVKTGVSENTETRSFELGTLLSLNLMIDKIDAKYLQNQEDITRIQAINDDLLKDKTALQRTIELLSTEL